MFSRMLSVTAIAGGLSLAGAGVAVGQAMPMEHPKGSQRTITGTVVDVSCKFGQGLSGDSHRQCAQICADKGIPLAILGQALHPDVDRHARRWSERPAEGVRRAAGYRHRHRVPSRRGERDSDRLDRAQVVMHPATPWWRESSTRGVVLPVGLPLCYARVAIPLGVRVIREPRTWFLTVR